MTPERIAELRAIIAAASLMDEEVNMGIGKAVTQKEFYQSAKLAFPLALDTIEAQQRRIEELEVDLRHLADARQAHINAVDHYNRMCEIMRYKEPGGMNITAEYHAMNDCQSEFIRAAQDVAGRQIARAALQPKEAK